MNPFWQDFQPKSKAVDSVVGIGVQLLIIIQGGWLLFDVAFIYSFIIMMVDNGIIMITCSSTWAAIKKCRWMSLMP